VLNKIKYLLNSENIIHIVKAKLFYDYGSEVVLKCTVSEISEGPNVNLESMQLKRITSFKQINEENISIIQDIIGQDKMRLWQYKINEKNTFLFIATINGEFANYTWATLGKKYKPWPFVKKDDIVFGPCLTYSKYGKKGLYSKVILYICNNYFNDNLKRYAYGVCNVDNIWSAKGLIKGGFKEIGIYKRKIILGISAVKQIKPKI